MFDEPDSGGSGGRLRPADCVGHLLLVWVIDYIEHSPTQYSRPDRPSDVVVVDAVDLDQLDDDGQPGLLVRKEWWRPGRLVRDLKGKVGRPNPMLVQMALGIAKPGNKAPFEILSMSGYPQAVARGQAWIKAHPDFRPSTTDPMWHQPQAQQPAQSYVPQQPQQTWVPAAHQPPSPPQPQPAPYLPPPPAPEDNQTMLERMAAQAARGRDRLPVQEEPPF